MIQTPFDQRNISMMMDLYELTMANSYYLTEDRDKMVAFDVFYRKNPDEGGYAIFAGLEQIVEYVTNMHFTKEDVDYLRSLSIFDEGFLQYLENFKFRGNVYAFREGTIMYPNEPVITVVAPLIDAQLVETEILAQINHQSLIATKARRIVRAANGRPVSDFGARRAHNNDAAIYGARACYIGGVNGTATVSAGQYFDMPVSGTMAHSYIMYYKDELKAFRQFAKIYPHNCILLVDTYDVIDSGMVNAIKVFKEMKDAGIESRNYGVRIDSGDLAYLTKKARKMLDEAGLTDAKIIVSNSLDEYTIVSLLDQGACINGFGVGERMITSKSEPVFGAVYKMCAVFEGDEIQPRIKVSDTVEKITNPGLKDVYRIYNKDGHAVADLLAVKGEELDMSRPLRVVDQAKAWKKYYFEDCKAVPLQRCVVKDGVRQFEPESLSEIRDYVSKQLAFEIWQEEQRFENPHTHYLDMTPAYFDMKLALLDESVMGE